MAKIKYYYDKNSLSYKRIKLSPLTKLKKIIYFSSLVALTSFLFIVIFFNFFDSPKEKKLKTEIHNLTEQYKLIDEKFNQVELVLDDLQNRDDNIYRVIFEAEPIASSIRKAGYGGINRYKELEGYNNSDLIIQTTKKIDQISKQMYIQSKSFDEIVDLAKNKNKMLASILQSTSINKDLSRMASGFGYKFIRFIKLEDYMRVWIFLQKLALLFMHWRW